MAQLYELGMQQNAHVFACVEREHRGGVQLFDAVAHGLEVVDHAHGGRAQLLPHRFGAQLLPRRLRVNHPRRVGDRAALVHHRTRGREARRRWDHAASLLRGGGKGGG